MISDDARANMMFEAHRKSVFVAYLLWFFVGMFSIHRFYLRHWLSGLAQMALGIFGPFSMIGGTGLLLGVLVGHTWLDPALTAIGAICLGLWLIWIFVDAILIPKLVRQCNENIVHQLTDRSTESGSGRDPSSFTGMASSRPSAFVVIGGIIALAGAVGIGFLLKGYNGAEAANPTANDQPQALADVTEPAGTAISTQPADVTNDQPTETAATPSEAEAAANDNPATAAAPATEYYKKQTASFDFNIASIMKAKQRAAEKGKAVQWSSEAGSGYAVPSSVTDVLGRPCRTIYVTSSSNGEESKSPSETLCRNSSGNWETAG